MCGRFFADRRSANGMSTGLKDHATLCFRALYEKGMRAFVSFIQSYIKHECNMIFRLKGEQSHLCRTEKLVFSLLSHHLNQPQRHCSDAVCPSTSTSGHTHPRFSPHCSPAARCPQEETSDCWWASIQRRSCTAAK